MEASRGFGITCLDGTRLEIPETTITRFAEGLDGALARPGEAAFDRATTIWNGMIRKRPALVVRAASTQDVERTIGLVRDHRLVLSVRGGGHNIAGLSLCDGGLTLDLSTLGSVEVDRVARTVRAGAGSTLGDIDRATQQHGLAATLGFISATGVAGLTLGGGFGYLTRRFGYTVDDLEEVEIVTADGIVRRASRTRDDDLFWAIRGGGGNFGVVTEFVFRLHEVGPKITGGIIVWHASEADAVLGLYRDLVESAPRELTAVVLRRNAPPAPWLPAEAHGKPMIGVLVCHSGDTRQAESDLAPLRAHGQPIADIVQVKDYVAQQAMLDATVPNGMHYYWKSEFLPGMSAELFDAFNARFDGLEAPSNQILFFHMGGATNEHDEDDGAVGNRDAQFACVIQAMWPPDSPAGAANREWVHEAWQAIKPFSTGGNYINFQTDDESDERTHESYRGNYERLARVKTKYDPTNLFRVNRNIAPATR